MLEVQSQLARHTQEEPSLQAHLMLAGLSRAEQALQEELSRPV